MRPNVLQFHQRKHLNSQESFQENFGGNSTNYDLQQPLIDLNATVLGTLIEDPSPSLDYAPLTSTSRGGGRKKISIELQ